MFATLCALVPLVSVVACGRGERAQNGAAAKASPFDGQAAYNYAKAQVDFGPRVPGTEGHRKAGDWIVAQMKQRADTVIEQTWTHVTADGKTLPLRNIIARFKPQATERILYVTHWDTRPIADEESDPEKRKRPILGANDGASGVGLFLALGDVWRKTPPSVGVDLLFTDGEDYGTFSPQQDVLLGSTYFAEHVPWPNYEILYGVLFDMIGDASLQIYKESNSVEQAPEVVARVWGAAQRLGFSRYFIDQESTAVTDDHVPLLKKGFRVIDVIDYDYDPHHKLTDTMDKVSSASLKIVGDLAVELAR